MSHKRRDFSRFFKKYFNSHQNNPKFAKNPLRAWKNSENANLAMKLSFFRFFFFKFSPKKGKIPVFWSPPYRLCALSDVENASLTPIQLEAILKRNNSRAGKRFQGLAMRTIDSSYRRPLVGYFVENLKIWKIFEKIAQSYLLWLTL